MPNPIPSVSPAAPIQRLAFGAVLASVAFSVAGTMLIEFVPSVAAAVGSWYEVLVKAPTWTYMIAAPVLTAVLYAPSTGWPRMAGFIAAGVVIGSIVEVLGTITGVPFGTYVYTSWLGPKLLGHVPYLIPLSWFALSLVSYELAGRVTGTRIGRIIVTALFVTLWDVALDPAMSRAFPFWIYPDGGFYFGMPWTNWLGWFLTAFVIAAVYDLIAAGRQPHHPWTPWIYAVHCAFPIMLCVLYGLPLAAVFGLLAAAVPLGWVHRATRRDKRSATA